MKTIIYYLTLVFLLAICHANAQVPTLNPAVRVWTDFDRERGWLSFYSYNDDFCDYYVHISFRELEGFEGILYTEGISATVGRGKQLIRSYRARTGATRHTYRYRYSTHRGNKTKKANTDFIYTLPVAAGDTVTATREVAPGFSGNYQLAFDLPSDSLYACRSGVVCDDYFGPSFDLSKITVYHKDGSLSRYIFKGKPLVAAGQQIKMGNPIAVVERDSDKYSVIFSTYFLDRNKKPVSHTYFLPFFQTTNEGKAQLQNEKIYTCELMDEMRMQDMSKREKKKFLKNKKQ